MGSIIQMTFQEALTHSVDNYPRVGVGVIVQQGGKVLLGNRRGAWCFPGGSLRFSESPEDCVRRELLNETGLVAQKIDPGPWTNDVVVQGRHYVTLFMIVSEIEGDPKGSQEWGWFDWEYLPEPLFLPLRTLIDTVGLQKLTAKT